MTFQRSTLNRTLPATAVRLITFTLVCLTSSLGVAAEIRLRGQCQPQGNLMLLGDVAEIFAVGDGEAEQLAAIELGPTPAAGTSRFVRVRELQDLLDARGVNLATHRFSGASQTTIHPVASTKIAKVSHAAPAPRAASISSKEAQKTAAEAIERYLQSIEPRLWQVKLQLSDAQTRQLQTATDEMTASGGQEPWTGKQRFVLSFASAVETVRLSIEAHVAVRPSVVVATRALARGAIVHAADLAVQPGPALEAQTKRPGKTIEAAPFSSIDEVVGREATRAIAAGQVLDPQYVRHPLLVRKGEVVTVYARSAGVQVRTTGRASDDGSLGDVVSVESLTDRQKFFARVTATQVVEIYARAESVGDGNLNDRAN